MMQELLRWYKKFGRKLPWRDTTDAYPLLVSEMMLQQTQVERVKDHFFSAWLKRFPDWTALAKADNATVITAWSGLGYNRRALALRDIARHIAAHGEPRNREAWLELKGIGPYTSAALAIFANREPVMPIDTNIRRVLGRYYYGVTYPQPKNDAKLERRAGRELLETKRYHDVPQALFDLASTHCSKIPDCASCPLRNSCKASPKFESGRYRVPIQMVKRAQEKKYRNKKYPDRIYRGRILKLARIEPGITIDSVGLRIDDSYEDVDDRTWLEAMINRLVHDQLLKRKGKKLSL
jgi:A/G-specific adenine glycosylase